MSAARFGSFLSTMRSSFSRYVWLHGCGRTPRLRRWLANRWRGAAKRGYWLYGSNILFARDENFGHPNLAVTWSLAIEEQFYLVWPLVVALTSRRGLMWLSGGLIVAALVLRTALVLGGAHTILPYVLPFCRMDALAAGALVALAMRRDRTGPPVATARLLTMARIGGSVAAVIVLAIWSVEDPFDNADWSEPLMQTAGYTTLALGYAAVVLLAAGGPADSWLARFFRFSALRTLGRYSYALYLFHVPVRRFIRDEYLPVASFPTWLGSPLPGQLLFYIAATAPALALAWISWHFYERQWLALTRYLRTRADQRHQLCGRASGSSSLVRPRLHQFCSVERFAFGADLEG